MNHLAFIRSLPCVICGNPIETEACHIRFMAPRKPMTGMGRKPEDKWVVPMCGRHHRLQHTMSERAFWDGHCLDPLKLATRLWSYSPNQFQRAELLCHIAASVALAAIRSSTVPNTAKVLGFPKRAAASLMPSIVPDPPE